MACSCKGQTFQRLGACPTLGCVFPPDQYDTLFPAFHALFPSTNAFRADFLAGQFFDIRLEVHAPVNGSEAIGTTEPDKAFTFEIAKKGGVGQGAADYFQVPEPKLETWNFTWYEGNLGPFQVQGWANVEDLFASDAKTPSFVNVVGKAYRRVALFEPGEYTATLTYNGNQKTVAKWLVRDISSTRSAKNVLLFIGDGMTTNMITAARLIGHKSVNGKYQSTLSIDDFPVIGHQMTHSLDSFITDSANSATALYTGHKSTVNALGVYRDSSPDQFDDPKVETIAELFRRLSNGGVGIVSTAFIADATPAALTAHTPNRDLYGQVVDSFLNGITNYTWTNWTGPDVLFGGGAEQFYPNKASFQGKDYYAEFASKGYNVVLNNTALQATSDTDKTLGIFSVSNLAKWLDRNVYPQNLRNQSNSPDGKKADALDQPGLKEMTLKALSILQARHGSNSPQPSNSSTSSSNAGWFLMSEAASIDKQMHTLDYDRALGELLELDDTVRASIDYLSSTGALEDTLILVTADHGHGFDVYGGVDTQYLSAQSTDRAKRNAIGTYRESGLSQYTVPPNSNTNGTTVFYAGEDATPHFPLNWDPRYTLAQGTGAFPDKRENFRVHSNGPRLPAVASSNSSSDYSVNPKDAPDGFTVDGTLPTNAAQGVHSLTDVPVFALGPCQASFGGTYGNVDVFFKMAACLGLSRPEGGNGTSGVRRRG